MMGVCLDKLVIVFDEFTSVVDREIAKVSAYAISKAVRRSKKQFVAVTCHTTLSIGCNLIGSFALIPWNLAEKKSQAAR